MGRRKRESDVSYGDGGCVYTRVILNNAKNLNEKQHPSSVFSGLRMTKGFFHTLDG
jgi:hypothetical protein